MTRDSPAPRVVLVAAGNRGVGLAVAEAFAAQGDQVAVTYRTTPVPGFTSVRCDTSSAGGVARALDEVKRSLGPVEVLVSSVGIAHEDPVLDTNLIGTYRTVRQAVMRMFRTREGRIVLISPVAAMDSTGQSRRAASNAAFVGFGRWLARELGSRNLTVNIVAPGLAGTGTTAALTAELRAALVPSRQAGAPTEIAGVATWLASPQASHVTGAVIPVVGGLGTGR